MLFIPELNVIKKDWRNVDLKVALCYPNVYRSGMTGMTIRLLYALLNARDDVACERLFIPTRNEPIRSLESNRPLKDFDVVAFTLQYEQDYVNVMRMLLESSIPVRREHRTHEDPLIIAGGPCTMENPEPLADYIDLFIIGDGEVLIDPLIDRVKEFDEPTKHIEDFADLKGVYVPAISNPVDRVWIKDLNDALCPVAQQVPLVDQRSPYMPIFGKTFVIEAVRGCNRCCRFCLIGHIGRPKRERNLAKIEEILDEGIRYTPVKKVSLIGAGLSDHSKLEEICELIVSRELEISIPSIRPDTVTERLAKLLAKGRQRRISLAPDGSTPRMRDIINKPMDDEQIVEAARTLLQHEVKRLKLYFIIGLPGETQEDVEDIANLSKRIADLGYGSQSVHLSVNPLIPKPHTPFQWEAFPSISYIRKCLRLLRTQLKGDRRFRISRLDPRYAQIQAFLSLGDRKVGKVVELATRYGGGLGAWRRALKECDISLEKYTGRKEVSELLSWSHIHMGLNRRFLIEENKRARGEATARRRG
ncbi:radical SAM protein [Candidatus Bathyarchaeota archaeon]|nr:MAG: radical SAM protein [Candidatus Bathyarchaeota archaeon]